MKWWPFFNFFIMADTDIPFPLKHKKLETQTLTGVHVSFFRVLTLLVCQPLLLVEISSSEKVCRLAISLFILIVLLSEMLKTWIPV